MQTADGAQHDQQERDEFEEYAYQLMQQRVLSADVAAGQDSVLPLRDTAPAPETSDDPPPYDPITDPRPTQDLPINRLSVQPPSNFSTSPYVPIGSVSGTPQLDPSVVNRQSIAGLGSTARIGSATFTAASRDDVSRPLINFDHMGMLNSVFTGTHFNTTGLSGTTDARSSLLPNARTSATVNDPLDPSASTGAVAQLGLFSQNHSVSATPTKHSSILVSPADIRDKALYNDYRIVQCFRGNTVGTSGAKVVYDKAPNLEHMDRAKGFKMAKYWRSIGDWLKNLSLESYVFSVLTGQFYAIRSAEAQDKVLGAELSGLVTAISADSMALLDRLAELPHTCGLEGSTPLTALMAKWTQLNVKNIMIAEITDLTHREQNAVSRFKQSLSEKIKVAYVQRTNAISIVEIIVHIHNVALRARVHDAIMHAKHVCAWLSHHEHPSSDQTSSVLHVTCASRIADAINRTQSLEYQCSRPRLRLLQRHRRLRSTMQPSAQCVASISQAASVSRTMQQHHGLQRRLHQSHHEHHRFRPATFVHS